MVGWLEVAGNSNASSLRDLALEARSRQDSGRRDQKLETGMIMVVLAVRWQRQSLLGSFL